jgi:uncharacterized protein YqfA (UPF0365 family)
MAPWETGLILLAAVVLLVGVVLVNAYGMLYIKALLAGASVSIAQIIGMRLRGVAPSVIVECRIMAVQAGLPIQTAALETHHLACGNVPNVVRALIAAKRAGIQLHFRKACAFDLMGGNVLETVKAAADGKDTDLLQDHP